MSGESHSVLTIGYSTHSLETLVARLRQHGVTALADVRSVPFSRFNPQFNKEALNRSLNAHGIKYVFLGRELGARSDDRSCYENGRVRYARLSQKDLFRSGIERVLRGTKDYRVALMCAEKEPLNCHRTLLVARALAERGVVIEHILADGSLESHETTMERLLAVVGLPHNDFFRSRDELIAEALDRQEERVAYVREESSTRESEGNAMKLFTIGFTKKSASRFFEMLRKSGAMRVVDVRLNNVSQLAGFAKKDDLAYFLKEICGMEYVHLPELTPTQEILDEYKKNRGDWKTYEAQFIALMKERHIEETVSKEVIADGCLLCSEDKPQFCHRRLVAEYLKQHWGEVDITHLA